MAGMVGTIIEDEQTFLDDVESFMKQRGVHFERDGKVAGRPISLHRLYKHILDLGGYDKVSAERLKWRELIVPFGLDQKHEPAMTFQLKTVYYKNLAAYEIARFWGETPPPPQILEDLTARGGDLRNRRLENYNQNSQAQIYDGVSDQPDEDEGQRTPIRNRPDTIYIENKESAGRQLRQDPKRTQMYQPDPTPERPRFTRATNSPQAVPVPVQQYTHAASDPWNAHFSVDKYQPRAPNALSLNPVLTPASHGKVFYQRKAMVQAQSMPRLPPDPGYLDQLKTGLPVSALQGPNIYNRTVQGLISSIETERFFALHHLVKVSDERGDKFTFAGFPGLAEGLIENCLEITNIVYGVEWNISYDLPEGVCDSNSLNACFGTPDLRQRIQSLKPVLQEMVPEQSAIAKSLDRIYEAALVLRNMMTLEANAAFIAKSGLFRDFLLIAINLPTQLARLDEFRHYALEMAMRTTRYWEMESDNPLYLTMAKELECKDRGRILLSLQAIYRIGVNSETNFNVAGLPLSTLQRLIAFLLLDDDDLVEATLEVLYTFTAYPENVIRLLREEPTLLVDIVPRLATFLLHDAVPVEEKILNRHLDRQNMLPASIPRISQDLYRALLQYPEPDRASRWLRCCFEESPQDDITQIAIWQAYSAQFNGVPHIQAADFIKNISATFSQAQAQVINGPQPRFIIKGIRARRVLVDMQGKGHVKCLWEHTRASDQPQLVYDNNGMQRHVCGGWFSTRQNLWLHILIEHLNLPRQPDGKFSNVTNADTSIEHKCKWIGCNRTKSLSRLSEVGIHIRAHIPDSETAVARIITELATIPQMTFTNGRQVPIPPSRRTHQDDLYTHHTFYLTEEDQDKKPAGIPFMAVMVLRNLARFVARHGGGVNLQAYPLPSDGNSDVVATSSDKDGKYPSSETDNRQRLMARMFNFEVRAHFLYVISVHKNLHEYVEGLLSMIEQGEKVDKKRRHEDTGESEDAEMTGEDTGLKVESGIGTRMMIA